MQELELRNVGRSSESSDLAFLRVSFRVAWANLFRTICRTGCPRTLSPSGSREHPQVEVTQCGAAAPLFRILWLSKTAAFLDMEEAGQTEKTEDVRADVGVCSVLER